MTSKSSQYYGVTKTSQTGSKSRLKEAENNPWQAAIWLNKTTVHLGRYATEKEAAIAVDKKIIDLNLDKPLNILKRK
jgi:hypothetical protein